MPNTKIKILIIAPSRKMGGIERALSVLANEWAEQDYNVVYISCLKGKPFYQLDSKIEVIEPSFKRSSSLLNKMLFYPRLLLFIRRSVKTNSPDRVVVFGDWFSPLSLLALLATNYQVYISDRTIPDYPFKFPIPHLKKWLYPKSAGFIAQTNRAKIFKENLFGNRLRIKVIPNALASLDTNNNKDAVKEKKILYVGRFEWEKDPEILIRAFKEVVSKNPEWTLEMAGDGPLFEKMKKLTNFLQIESNVFFHGKVNNVEKLYISAEIFVLPSVIEGFPNALIEAMSFGLPCVCFSDIPYEDILEPNSNGIVLFDRNVLNLAKSINDLIEQPYERERLGTLAREIRAKCAPKRVSCELLTFMDIVKPLVIPVKY
jgi:glycosyltransferase involved in cell wall biosynthesis